MKFQDNYRLKVQSFYFTFHQYKQIYILDQQLDMIFGPTSIF
jgi:hypothetical protein